jgi:hypothetical protein
VGRPAFLLTDFAPIAAPDTEVISTPDRIRRRSRMAQAICLPSATRFGKPWCDICRRRLRAGPIFRGIGDLAAPDRRRAGLVGSGLRGLAPFHSGVMAPRQFVKSRRRRLSESQRSPAAAAGSSTEPAALRPYLSCSTIQFAIARSSATRSARLNCLSTV